MQRGDFYASNGVELLRVDFDTKTGILQIEIKPAGTARFTTEFIGTPVGFDATSKPRINKKTKKAITGTRNYSADVGKVFKSVQGLTATYQLTGKELYVRARITSDQAPANPTTESSRSQAWTQPVGWQKHLK
ncbi:MAG: hypothetical protein GY917_30710 [Planctomycetaceae bacterium]|nr:hypothetical protein [Planctomycetaceae bacterium]